MGIAALTCEFIQKNDAHKIGANKIHLRKGQDIYTFASYKGTSQILLILDQVLDTVLRYL